MNTYNIPNKNGRQQQKLKNLINKKIKRYQVFLKEDPQPIQEV